MKNIYILGNGGFAQEIFEQYILCNTTLSFKGFIILKENNAFLIGDDGINPFNYDKEASFILGTGNKKWRKLFLAHFLSHYPKTPKHFPNITTPKAHVSAIAKLGIGNVFCSFSLVNGNADVGDFNLFNTYSCIHHDSTMLDNNILSPYAGIMGYCKLGNDNFFGVNSCLTPKITIKDENTISAGEVVFDDMNSREFFQSGLIFKKK